MEKDLETSAVQVVPLGLITIQSHFISMADIRMRVKEGIYTIHTSQHVH